VEWLEPPGIVAPGKRAKMFRVKESIFAVDVPV
jgi:hypothetical protein